MKRFLLCLLALGALAASSLVVLPTLVSSDWMRAELGRQLSAATGSSIALNGPVKLSVFPHLAVVAEDVALSAEAKGVMAEIGELAGSVTLSSLWSNRLHIKEIKVAQPVIMLHEKADDTSTTRDAGENQAKPGDPLSALVTFLERSAIDSVSIVDGTLNQEDSAGSKQTITDVDLSLAVPDIDGELSLSASAKIEERRYQVTLAISSLRPLLERQPADLSLSFEADPAPAPGLSEFEATGQAALNANGSYQIRGGKFSVGEQVLGLDALFIPGDRPRFLADLVADRLDLSAFVEATSASSQQSKAQSGKPAAAGLQLLEGFDADVSVSVGDLAVGDVSASDVAFAATLKDGRLTAQLEHLGIDAGSVAANVTADVRGDEPTFQGRVSSKGLDIGKLASLAGQSAPLSGAVTIDTGFAFRGLTGDALKKTINMTGSIGLRNATFVVPGVADQSMREVTAKKLAVRIENLAKPVHVSANLAWRGKPVDVDLRVPIRDLLLGGKPGTADMPFKLDLRMPDAALALDGKAAFPSDYGGKVNFSTANLRAFLDWLGQSGAGSIDQLAFSGDVSAGATGVSFEEAVLSVNGVEGTGNGSVQFTTPLKISSALNFAELDFARLAGARSPAAEPKAKEGRPAPDVPLDLSSLRSIEASIQVNAKKLGYGRVFAGPVATTLVIADGVANLKLPESPFYGGHVAANLKADGSGGEPAIALQASISGASAAPLLSDMANFRNLEGALQAQIDVTGAGGTTRALTQSLQGTANVRFSDGAIRGIDVADAYNNLVGLMSSGFKQDESKATGFTELGASFAIEGGVARTEDIKLVGPLVRMSGSGEANIPDGRLKFRLDPRMVASLEGQGAGISTDGIGVPVIVEGPFAKPRIYPDLSGLLKNPGAALATLKKFGLPTDKLRIDDLLSGGGTGGSVRDIVGGAIDKTLKGEGNQLSIEEIIGGSMPESGEAPPIPQVAEEPGTPTVAAEQSAPVAGQPDQETGAFEKLFNQLLQ
ncbi:AsmA family protein [Sinorhizobium psoraleae]|uniref:AsmA family protein n=1 Tax=Sinorhizobium psoraleae TaxID=520838 RepID=A0ABT4KBG4_9HYPH|nr:AsmA family protein [Sinorhizobium psoraleae]MCZ4089252.1 AsmA family protein [Sinorhizobium psoraleae]